MCSPARHGPPPHRYYLPSLVRIFEIAPGAQDAFTFGVEVETGSEELYKSELFQVHANALFLMVDAVVALVRLGQTEKLAETLVDLGRSHHKYGVRAIHYPIVGTALIHTLKTALGADYTPQVHQANTVLPVLLTHHRLVPRASWMTSIFI
jgi:hypothetical protein